MSRADAELARITSTQASEAYAVMVEGLVAPVKTEKQARVLAAPARQKRVTKSDDSCCVNCAIARRRSVRNGTTYEAEKRFMEARGVSFLKEGTRC